jgi:ABC-type sulfate transport system permease component
MLDRLRSALVESFVGAIALGYLLAEVILGFVNIFGAPLGYWVSRNEFRGLEPPTGMAPVSPLEFAIPELVKFFLMLIVWYVLLRWLYLKPHTRQTTEPPSR